ncbi:hypothetical protein IH785_05675 [candidate division KSB1 bacterium]|nr:hypothetical protein [candidate division KSB1 bacterium]
MNQSFIFDKIVPGSIKQRRLVGDYFRHQAVSRLRNCRVAGIQQIRETDEVGRDVKAILISFGESQGNKFKSLQ